jgi:sugar lactone lactonase YvrE
MSRPRTNLSRGLVGAALLCVLFAPGATAQDSRLRPQLLVSLPDACPTPDGMAIDADGNLVVACPNFADATQPGCLIRIDRQRRVTPWVDVPPLAETGRACPMGIAFGPDGDLYVCDNQNWPTGNGPDGELNQGRLLRLRIREGRIVRTAVVAHRISHPNGVRVDGDQVYITVSLLPKIRRDDGLLVSGVYRFRLDDEQVAVTNTLDDPNLLVTFVTRNRDCQYGADGLAFDSQGNLLVGNFGDGALHKVTFDAQGRVTGNTVFAKTDFATPMSAPDFQDKMVRAKMRTTDGICIDGQDNIFVADFSNNAVCKVDPQGHITVLAQSPDGDGSDGGLDQPGEPILWDGKLVVTCFDMVTGPDKVNTKHDKPFTLSYLEWKP